MTEPYVLQYDRHYVLISEGKRLRTRKFVDILAALYQRPEIEKIPVHHWRDRRHLYSFISSCPPVILPLKEAS